MSKDIPHITCEHLNSLRKDEEKEHIVLDIRDRLDYESGHIKGSVHVPLKELDTNVATVLPEKAKRVVVVFGPTDEHDIESVHERLMKLGYTEVEFLAGGFDKWCEIAPLDVDDLRGDTTPEERGFTGDDLSNIDPEGHDNEPMY
ncbi:rhodanese-like domain-containing protein [Patescibacteria group bacterium]